MSVLVCVTYNKHCDICLDLMHTNCYQHISVTFRVTILIFTLHKQWRIDYVMFYKYTCTSVVVDVFFLGGEGSGGWRRGRWQFHSSWTHLRCFWSLPFHLSGKGVWGLLYNFWTIKSYNKIFHYFDNTRWLPNLQKG